MGILTKKVFSIVMVFMLFLTIVPVNIIVAATADFTITIEADKETVEVGDQVTVYVKIPANTNLCAYSFSLMYDNTKLSTTTQQCTTPLKTGTAMASVNSKAGQVNVAEMGAMSDVPVTITQAGSLLEATFDVLDGAAGELEFSIKSNAKFNAPISADDDTVKDLTYDVTDNTNVFVNAPLKGITLKSTELDINEGETSEAIGVTYNPENTTDSKEVTWTSKDKDIATVSTDGKVTGVKAGTTTVTATSKANGTISASCTINVKAPISSIELSPKTIEINEGDTSEAINVTYNPENTTDTKEVTWTSQNTSIATVSTDGKVTGVKAGTTTITATTKNNKTDTVTVNVKAPLTGINLNKSQVSMELNDEDTLIVSYDPENTTDNKDVTWKSSDDSKVRVEKLTENTAKIVGVAVTQRNTPVTITAIVGKFEATCDVSVTVPVSSVVINEQDITLERKISGKDTTTLTATINPEGALENSDVEWVSADKSIATVTKRDATTATVTAVSDGTVEIKATIGGKEATTTITVITPVQSIALDKDEMEVTTGDKATLNVIYTPDDVTESLKGIVWESSDDTKATVLNGVVTTLAPTGSTPVTITATSTSNNSAIATCDITILPIPLEGVQIEETEVTLEKGTSKILKATCLPENTTDNTDLTWSSSDPSVVSVDESTGEIKALAPTKKGSPVTITATSKTNPLLKDTCLVNVTVTLTGIELNNKSVTLKRGVMGQDTITLTATPIPSDTTDNTAVKWTSSNNEIATVDENTGVVTSNKAGTVQITATSVANSSIKAICTVTVEVPLQSISLNKTNTEILIKQSETLIVTYNPEDTSDNKGIKWTSSSDEIATVDENGKVTALKEGEVKITATSVVDDSIKATCTVKTKRIPLDSIALSESTAEVLKGKSLKLSVICNPENTTDDTDVTWKSSDESIAIVDENGNVTALKEGEVKITATSKSNDTLSATCDISVKEVHVDTITIDKDNIDMSKVQAGNSFKLSYKLNPDNATDNVTVIWTSSDPSIATIDNEGNVTALKEGNVKFTAFITTEYGNTFEDTYEMYIKPEEVETISPATSDINVGLLVAGMVASFGTILFITKKKKSIKEK